MSGLARSGIRIRNNESRMETKIKQWISLMVLGLCSGLGPVAPATHAEDAGVGGPSFQEVYELLRANLPGIDEVALQKAAVRGLLSQFADRVSIKSTEAQTSTVARSDSVEVRLLEERFLYLKLAAVDGVVADSASKLQSFLATNQVIGGVLDLRFAHGHDFASAAGVASQIVSSNQPLFDWGKGMAQATGTSVVARIPWTILVNAETSGSPEALAAALRYTETGILVGSKTAGNAATFREFPLRNGQRLSIANQPVKTPDGKDIPNAGLVPDIVVSIDLEQERLYHQDPSRTLSKSDAGSGAGGKSPSGAAKAPRRRVNEADLVRLQKEGKRLDSDTVSPASSRETIEETPRVQDPALNRAVDLLKGLAIVRKARR